MVEGKYVVMKVSKTRSDTAGTDIHTTDGKRPGSGKRSDFIMRSL